MRQVIRALLAGSLAFGLIAAAASSATFGLTVQDIIRTETSEAAAELVVAYVSCQGSYHIEWVVEDGGIVGFTAELAEEDPYCANQSFQLFVSRLDGEDEDGFPSWGPFLPVSTDEDKTDSSGNIEATFTVPPFDVDDGDEISLVIGPEAPEFFS